MFLHFERICARIPRSGLISFQFQVNFATVLLFSWTVSWCVCVCGLSFISDSVCVCECLRANVDAICTFGSVLMYFQVWICFCQVRISDHLLSSKAAFANKSGVENSVCVDILWLTVKTFSFIWVTTFYFINTKLAKFEKCC